MYTKALILHGQPFRHFINHAHICYDDGASMWNQMWIKLKCITANETAEKNVSFAWARFYVLCETSVA